MFPQHATQPADAPPRPPTARERNRQHAHHPIGLSTRGAIALFTGGPTKIMAGPHGRGGHRPLIRVPFSERETWRAAVLLGHMTGGGHMVDK